MARKDLYLILNHWSGGVYNEMLLEDSGEIVGIPIIGTTQNISRHEQMTNQSIIIPTAVEYAEYIGNPHGEIWYNPLSGNVQYKPIFAGSTEVPQSTFVETTKGLWGKQHISEPTILEYNRAMDFPVSTRKKRFHVRLGELDSMFLSRKPLVEKRKRELGIK